MASMLKLSMPIPCPKETLRRPIGYHLEGMTRVATFAAGATLSTTVQISARKPSLLGSLTLGEKEPRSRGMP